MLYRKYMNYSCLYNNDSTTKLPSQTWEGVLTMSAAVETGFSRQAGKQKGSLKQQPLHFLKSQSDLDLFTASHALFLSLLSLPQEGWVCNNVILQQSRTLTPVNSAE